MAYLMIEAARFLRCGRMRARGKPTHRATLTGCRDDRVRDSAQGHGMDYAQFAGRRRAHFEFDAH
jgi:hypothetical protein